VSNKWILSATEIETFGTCQRKWGYQYLDGIRPPPSKATKLGSAVHLVLQDYLTGNRIDDKTEEGRIASAGLSLLPQALPKTNVERPIFFKHDENIFHGYIDFYEQIGSQSWLIGDHKTCSSFRTALTPEQLKTNIQANIYAQWAFKELGAETVKLHWIYYRTKGKPEARLVEAEIKKHESLTLFKHPSRIASDIMAVVKKRPDSLDLPKNKDACFKYGPCPFLSSCRANKKPEADRRVQIKENLSLNTSNAPKPTEHQALKPKESFHLFVDCAPTKEAQYQSTIELSDFLKPVLTKIQQEKNLAHYRLAGYGQHVGIMASYLEEYLSKSNLNNSTAILSSSKTPEGIDTLQTLSAAASVVVRGF
jgi:hypothetical protein